MPRLRLVAHVSPCERHLDAYEYMRGWKDRAQLQVLLGHMMGCRDCRLAWDEVSEAETPGRPTA